MNEDTWLEVDDTGHVPGVAAELPPGHKVLLDAAGNLMAIVPLEAVAALESALAEQEQQQESDAPPTHSDGQETAHGDDAPIASPVEETPVLPAVDAAATPQEPVAELDTSVQPDAQTSIQDAPESDAHPLAVGGTVEPEQTE